MPEDAPGAILRRVQVERPPADLKAFAMTCIGQLTFGDRSETDGSLEQEYLAGYCRHFAAPQNLALELQGYLDDPFEHDACLVDLYRRLGLDEIELLTLALARAIEEDSMAGRAIAFVQAPLGGSRPTLGLLQSAFAPLAHETRAHWVSGAILSGMAVRSGVLDIINSDAPLPEQAVRIPAALVLALGNHDFLWPGTASVADDSMPLLPDSIRQQARQQALSLQNQANGILLIRSVSLREGRSVASEVCLHLQLQPIFSNADPTLLKGLGALCLIKRRIPIFEYSLAPGEVQTVPDLPGYAGARIAIAGVEGHLESHSGSIQQWAIPLPDRQEREDLWTHYLGDPQLAETLAGGHLHSSGRIMQLAQLSQREARLAQRDRPVREDIEKASWTNQEGNLGSLVQPITSRIPDRALVLPQNTRAELEHLLQRCRYRENLDATLGVTVKARYQTGVRALLVGPSGTGKTLVTSWIATRLGLPLYRVDIASVVSKYIGETEKNLATLLARAEQSEIVLLFDEADSLFGKRTDIKDANDRHANSQTNYLLQRIESYQGIVLLTSNSRGRFDSAFTRRLDTVIAFPLPTAEERRSLWQSHLGNDHELSLNQLNRLAVSSELAGGHIRNAVLAAAVQAQSEQRQIAFDDVLAGLEIEYRKLGRQIPAAIRRHRTRKLSTD